MHIIKTKEKQYNKYICPHFNVSLRKLLTVLFYQKFNLDYINQ